MEVKITAHSLLRNESTAKILKEVELCPICKKSISATVLFAAYDSANIYTLNFCNACKECFMAKYDWQGRVLFAEPNRYETQEFSDGIKDISPQFIKIFNQACAAECSNLDEVAGIGFRKALEFLVKDFVVYEHSEEEEKIKAMPLSQCINKYIDNPQIKELAEKSTWIGNDETHYIKKHTDKDINDLKKFIKALEYFVSMHLIYRESKTINHS